MMAVDTAAKRASAMAFGMPLLGPLPIPDASVDQGDRQHLLGCYSGIDTSVVAPPTPDSDYILYQRGNAAYLLGQYRG